MYAHAVRDTVCVLALFGLAVSGATADPPAKQDVVYKIHDDPSDPNSDVVLTIGLTLVPTARDGNSIGWEIGQIRFRELSRDGSPDATWIESNAVIPTSDGRWWINHADPANPQLAEFAQPPHLWGTAMADDPNQNNLDYDFQGTGPMGLTPWEPTGWLDYELAVEGESQPLDEGEDEPVEIDDEGDPDS